MTPMPMSAFRAGCSGCFSLADLEDKVAGIVLVGALKLKPSSIDTGFLEGGVQIEGGALDAWMDVKIVLVGQADDDHVGLLSEIVLQGVDVDLLAVPQDLAFYMTGLSGQKLASLRGEDRAESITSITGEALGFVVLGRGGVALDFKA